MNFYKPRLRDVRRKCAIVKIVRLLAASERCLQDANRMSLSVSCATNSFPFRFQHFVQFTNAPSTTNAKERKQRGATRARNHRFPERRKERGWATRERKKEIKRQIAWTRNKGGIESHKRVERIQWLVSTTIIELSIKENDLKLRRMTFSVLQNFKRNSRRIIRIVEIIYCPRARESLPLFLSLSLLRRVYPLAKSLHTLAIYIYISRASRKKWCTKKYEGTNRTNKTGNLCQIWRNNVHIYRLISYKVWRNELKIIRNNCNVNVECI